MSTATKPGPVVHVGGVPYATEPSNIPPPTENCGSCHEPKDEGHGERCSCCGVCPERHDEEDCVRLFQQDAMFDAAVRQREKQAP